MGKKEKLRQELEEALAQVAQQRGKKYAAALRPIVLTNWQNERVERFVDNGTVENGSSYVKHVERCYDAWHEYVHSVQKTRDEDVWQELFGQLCAWAYGFLKRKLPGISNEEKWDHAKSCAAEAAIQLIKSRFPYDTEFGPWAYVVLRNVSYSYLKHLFSSQSVPHHEVIDLEKWEGWLQNLSDPSSQKPFEQFEVVQLLQQAIQKLPPGQKEFVLLYYLEEKSYREIAQLTGRSTQALYKA